MALVTSAAAVLQYDNFLFYNETALLLNDAKLQGPSLHMQPMTADRRIDYSANGAYYVLGWCALCIFGVGVPLKFVLYYRALRAEDPTLELAQEQLCFLVKNFRPERWYWEGVIMLRKMGSLVAVAALRSYPVAQVQAYVLVIAVYLAWHSHASPNLSRNAALVETISCMSAIATANVLLFTTASVEWMTSLGPSITIFVVQVLSLGSIVAGSLMEAKDNDLMTRSRTFTARPSSPPPPTSHERLPRLSVETYTMEPFSCDGAEQMRNAAGTEPKDKRDETIAELRELVLKLSHDCEQLRRAMAAKPSPSGDHD